MLLVYRKQSRTRLSGDKHLTGLHYSYGSPNLQQALILDVS